MLQNSCCHTVTHCMLHISKAHGQHAWELGHAGCQRYDQNTDFVSSHGSAVALMTPRTGPRERTERFRKLSKSAVRRRYLSCEAFDASSACCSCAPSAATSALSASPVSSASSAPCSTQIWLVTWQHVRGQSPVHSAAAVQHRLAPIRLVNL